MKKVHPAEIYRKIRGTLFSIYHKDGIKKALSYLESKKHSMPFNSYIGVQNELFFYIQNNKKFNLTVAGDYGDFCDFSGVFYGQHCRFDVTTNLAFKDLKKYEPFQKKGRKYYIAIMDYKKNTLREIIDVNFPFCPECGGRLFDILVLTPEDKMPDVSDIQKIVSVCSNDPYSHYYIRKESTEFFFNTFEAIAGSILSHEEFEMDPIKQKFTTYENYINDELKNYAIESAKFLKKVYQMNIVACGGESYIVRGRDGDGYWSTKMRWKHDVVLDYLDDIYETIFEI